MKLSIKWVKHCKTNEERKEVMAKVLASVQGFALLKKLIIEEIEIVERNRKKKDLYKESNWALFQADSIGEERALRSVLKLLSITEEDLND